MDTAQGTKQGSLRNTIGPTLSGVLISPPFDAVIVGSSPTSPRTNRGGGGTWSARLLRIGAALTSVTVLAVMTGCTSGPDYRQLRLEGQRAALNGQYGVGRNFFFQCEQRRPRKDADNLHDLGACSVMVSRQKFAERNYAAAMRELDAAVAYYSWAVNTNPGHQAAIEGKSIALELKGQYDEALKNAEWAAEFVGPSARQYIWLARELEKRGDLEAAVLRYRQAVQMEPRNAKAHAAIADFYLRVDNRLAAVEHLEAAYRLNPRDVWAADKLVELGETARLTPPVRRGTTLASP